MHANPLVGFLRHYGPIAAQDNMYDERIHDAREKAGVAPIDAPPLRLANVVNDLQKDGPRVVVLTGTAGDGKTYHCRRAHRELGGDPAAWATGAKRIDLSMPAGGTVVIVKDLSEATPAEKEELLPRIAAAARGEGAETFLLAANDGQLVATFRGWAASHSDRQPLFREVEAMLVNGRTASTSFRLTMYNLSRERHGGLFDTLAGLIVNHPDWSRCDGCPAEGFCPILENRRRLADGTPFRTRLSKLIDLAGANDQHLPIRHLLMLTVNILLGDGRDRKCPLLTCRKAQKRRAGETTSPYANALGLNIPEKTRFQYQVFSTLDAFGVGKETDNRIDDLLVMGHLVRTADYDALVAADTHFGEPAYRHERNRYLEGERDSLSDFFSKLEEQRCRLFFTLPDNSGAPDPWHLTVFRHAGGYLAFCHALVEGKPIDATLGALVRGLNRTFTGMMLDTRNEVLLCSAGGDGRSRVARFLEHKLPIGRRRRDPYLEVVAGEDGTVPQLQVVDPLENNAPVLGAMPLRLTHFEYLMRVADGSLPASFSRQCFEDFHDFKLTLIERLPRDADEPGLIHLVAVEADAAGIARDNEITYRVPSHG